MKKAQFLEIICVIVAFCIASAIAAPAQTFTSLASFDYTNGAVPTGFILGSDGNFYGTTDKGGQAGSSCNKSCGTIFEFSGGTITTLHEFNGTDGNGPTGLLEASGVFYGTTSYGGANNCTSYGSTGPCGTVYKFSGGSLTTLYNFCQQANCTDGAIPWTALFQGSDGNFYGTTTAGGTGVCDNPGGPGCGTVFKITAGGTLTTLHSFTGSDGAFPYGTLIEVSGNFYGTTTGGGANGYGTVFQITPTGTLTTIHNFAGSDGAYPYAGLVLGKDGNFYGTTAESTLGANGPSCTLNGNGNGTIFKMTTSGSVTTLHSFDGTDGSIPYGGVIQGADSNFYGTTSCGGVNSDGTIYQLAADTLTTLHNFDVTDGAFPFFLGGPVQAANGTFYGATVTGGANTDGTIYSLSLSEGAPAVTLSPTSLTFAKQVLGTTSPAKTVTVTNSGTATLDISNIAASANFAISKSTCGTTLAAGKNCKVSVTFTPTELGSASGTLTFDDNAANSPQTVALAGTGIAPATLTPASATYPKQKVGTTSKPKTFTLTNNQTTTLTGIVTSTTGDFAVSATTCKSSLAAKGKCTISVTFTPTQTGTRTGQLSVSDSASNSPQVSTLTGTGD